jgi:hypothetical protein
MPPALRRRRPFTARRITDRSAIAAMSYAGDRQNIQIADLNMLNAVFAVIRWKKLYGFYADDEHELFTAYTIAANQLLNADQLP